MANTFRKVFSFSGNGHEPIPISKWQSTVSGMKVYFADLEGPIITADMCLATEAFNDDGLPHCVEHLAFMGSQNYPYKGLIDKIANRTLSTAMNATTESDHTTFRFSTASDAGLLSFIPVLLDHLFFPLLKESAYITEVYHVNGRGEDGGVLYTEMLYRENALEEMAHACFNLIYPERCGYRFNMGARLGNLRTTTNLDAVRRYHKQYYRPDNFTLVIEGDLDKKKMLDVISKYETKKIAPMVKQLPPFVRPWHDEIEPLRETSIQTIDYACQSEQFGLVYVAWRGPEVNQQYDMLCIHALIEYLMGNSNSPLHKKLMDELSLCSSMTYTFQEYKISCVKIQFENVPTDRLDDIKSVLDEELSRIWRNQSINMADMKRIIEFQQIEASSAMEIEGDGTLVHMCFIDTMFGNSNEDFRMRLNHSKLRQRMLSEPISLWLNLLQKFFVGAHKVVVEGKPSKNLMQVRGINERQRVEERRQRLGPNGLKALEDRLQAAIIDHEKNSVIPNEVIADIAVPNVNDIKFHYIQSSTNFDTQRYNIFKNFPVLDIDFLFQVDDMHTNNVQVSALMNTSSLSPRLRLYLPLISQILFELPLEYDGQWISHDRVSSKLNKHTLLCNATMGIDGDLFQCGRHPQLFAVTINTERAKYETGAYCLKDILHHSVFEPSRIKIGIERMKGKVEAHKRLAAVIMKIILSDLLYSNECNLYVTSVFRQQTFLGQLLRRLETAPEEVLSDFEAIRTELLKKKNFHIHMAADVKSLSKRRHPSEPWETFYAKTSNDGRRSTNIMLPTWKYVRPLQQLEHRHYIMGVGSDESACLTHTTVCIKDFNHRDHAALKVFIFYLSQNEGPLWSTLRGHGIVYGFRLLLNPEHGLLTLEIHPTSDVVQAFTIAHRIIMDVCHDRRPVNELELENAIVRVMYNMVVEEKSKREASLKSMLSVYRRVSPTYNREMLKMVAGTTLEQLRRIGIRYFEPLFDIHHCRSVICCHPSKVAYVKDEFRKLVVH